MAKGERLMAVDIIAPEYWITELFGGVLIFSVFLVIVFLWFGSQKKLPFQWIVAILTLAFLMLPMIFDGFLSWVPLIIIVIGIIVGTIFYRFLERT